MNKSTFFSGGLDDVFFPSIFVVVGRNGLHNVEKKTVRVYINRVAEPNLHMIINQ